MTLHTLRHWPVLLLLLLVAADLAFVFADLLHRAGFAAYDRKFQLDQDRGYGEIYQYIKLFWITLLLGWMTLCAREPVYAVAAALFFYLLLDDSLMVHETLGGHLADWAGMTPAFGLRSQDFGELAVYGLVGGTFLLAGWMAYRYSSAFARRTSFWLLGGVLALAAFGAGTDLIHQMLAHRFAWMHVPLLLLEDGGEMLVVSVICWFSFSLVQHESWRTATVEPAR